MASCSDSWRTWNSAVLLVVFTCMEVSGSGVFQLRLRSFKNALSVAADGRCCAAGQRIIPSEQQLCPAACNTFFRICLSHYQSVVPHHPICTYGLVVTDVMDSDGKLAETLQQREPIGFPFQFTWPGSFTLVIEAWHDSTGLGPTTGSQRILIWHMAIQEVLNVSHGWTLQKNSRMTYEYRVICDGGFHGAGCVDVCVARNDRFGHYDCDNSSGRKICHTGWSGTYCDTPVCIEGCRGFCNRPSECRCRQGWQGVLCDECVTYPGCQHGYCTQPWQCICHHGWGGIYCSHDLNYCTRHRPCRHGSTCTNTGHGGYTCSCPRGFAGTDCELDIRDCRHQLPCLHGGSCQMNAAGRRYECRCRSGHVGSRCEWKASLGCEQQPCQNGGVCAVTDISTQLGYRCTCRPGYTGQYCEVNVDECLSHICLNGGRCIDEVNGYRCVCPAGFTGSYCDVDNNDCLTLHNPCLNGGICVDGFDSFSCLCPTGYAGPLCQFTVATTAVTSKDCRAHPCVDGTCVELMDGSYRCLCQPGVDCGTGATSGALPSLRGCLSGPCRHGATCVDMPPPAQHRYRCRCLHGFHGAHCELSDSSSHSPTTLSATRTSRTTVGQPSTVNETTLADDNDEDDVIKLSLQELILIGFAVLLVLVLVLVAVLIACLCRRRSSNATVLGYRWNSATTVSVDVSKSFKNELNSINNNNNRVTLSSGGQCKLGWPPSTRHVKLQNVCSNSQQPQNNSNVSLKLPAVTFPGQTANSDIAVNLPVDVKRDRSLPVGAVV